MDTWPSKRVGENDFRGADWSGHLSAGETITDYDFLLQDDSSLTLVTKSSNGSIVLGRFTGGVSGTTETVVSQITTSATPPRILENAFSLCIE